MTTGQQFAIAAALRQLAAAIEPKPEKFFFSCHGTTQAAKALGCYSGDLQRVVANPARNPELYDRLVNHPDFKRWVIAPYHYEMRGGRRVRVPNESKTGRAA